MRGKKTGRGLFRPIKGLVLGTTGTNSSKREAITGEIGLDASITRSALLASRLLNCCALIAGVRGRSEERVLRNSGS
jgi:hypothetical protein